MLPSRSFYCTVNHCHSDRDCTLPAVGRCGVPSGGAGTVRSALWWCGGGRCGVPRVGAVWSSLWWGGVPRGGAGTVQSALCWGRDSAECPAVGRWGVSRGGGMDSAECPVAGQCGVPCGGAVRSALW